MKRLPKSSSLAAVALWIFAGGSSADADSWAAPKAFEVWAQSSNYVATVSPGGPNQRAIAEVFKFENGRRRSIWSSELSNAVSPVKALLTDNGQNLVTFDNWGRVGYGDDVLVFYNSNGLVKKYSLEQIVSRSADELDSRRFGKIGSRLQHSTSSRNWRRNSIEMLEWQNGRWTLSFWLEWERRWHVWDVATGEPREKAQQTAKHKDDAGRHYALQKIRAGKGTDGAYEFLGSLRHPEDRRWIEALLKDRDFTSGTLYSSTSDPVIKRETLTYFSHSAKREMADRILSEWDKKPERKGRPDKEYNYLGQIDGIVSLSRPPKEKDGALRIYITDTDRTLESLKEDHVAHYLKADFSYMSTYAPKNSTDLRFSLQGVTPGQYKALVIWDRNPSSHDYGIKVVTPRSGDYVSAVSRIITVHSNKITTMSLACTNLIGASRN